MSFSDLVKKANSGKVNVGTKLNASGVNNWYKSASSIAQKAYNYLSADGYKKADESLLASIDEYLASANDVAHYLRVNKSGIEDYDKQYKDHFDFVSGLRSLRDSLQSSNRIYSKWDSEDAYNKDQMGWLDESSESTPEQVAARQAQYKSNQDRMAVIDKQMPWYGNSWMPNFMEDLFMSDEQTALRNEYEKLQAENNLYDRIQGKTDKHYMPVTPEFIQGSANRDFTNATKDELRYHDSQFLDYATKWNNYSMAGSMGDGGAILDPTGRVVYAANDYSKAYMEGTQDAFYNGVVKDKLGMFLAATDEDYAEALTTVAGGNSNDTWANLIMEGENNAWKQLTEHEINTYYYYLNTQGQAAAYQYLEDMTVVLTKRATEQRADEYADAGVLEQIALNIASIPMNVFGGVVGLVGDAANAIEGKDYNPYSAAHSWTNDAGAIRQDTAMDINKATGNAALPVLGYTWGDVYQSLMSGADSLAGAALGGTTYGLLMGTGAATSTMRDMYEKGATMEQMVAGGILSGAAEMFFEKYSIDKLVTMGDSKTIKGIIINTLKQGGIEASEEMFTEIANTISNYVIMGSQSDWVDAATFAKNVVNAGLSGFLSSGVSAGLINTANYAKYNQNMTKHGAEILAIDGADPLKQLALEMAAEENGLNAKSLTKAAGKVSDAVTKKNANKLGRLSDLMGETVTAKDAADVVAALVEKGISNKDAKRYATYLTNEKSLDQKDKAKIEAEIKNNDKVKAVVKEILDNPTSAAAERQTKLLAARMGVKSAASTLTGEKTTTGGIALQNNVDVKDKVSESNETVRISTGEAIKIDKGNAIAKTKIVDGKRVVYYNTDKGVVEASDVAYASEDEGLLFEAVSDLNPAFANAIIKNYDGTIPVQTYIKGMREGVVLYGMHNFQEVGKDISKSSTLAELSKEDQDFALKLGRAYAKANAKKGSNAIRTALKHAEEQAIAAGEDPSTKKIKGGRVSFETGTKAATKSQRRAVQLAKILSKSIGIDIVFYDATTTTDKRGQKANGFFDPKTNRIHLDLQNADSDTKTIVFTMSHEIVHFIKKWSPAKFNTFANFLMKQYAAHGISTEQLLANKMAEMGTTDSDKAYEELVCDACERMLLDSNAVTKLAELRREDLSLFEKLKLHISDLLRKIRGEYEERNYNTTTDEGQALQKMTDVLEQLHSMFEDAAVDAVQTYQKAKSLNAESLVVADDGTIQLQMKQYQQTGRSTLLNYLREQYGDNNANDLIATIDNIYNVMAEIKEDTALSVFGNWQDTEVELDADGHPIFTTSINNGDYELNQDFSRVCKKRRQLNFVLNMLSEDPAFEASNLTKQDFVKINKAIKEHGFEIACALCFVDSKRFRQAEWADSFANTWNDILGSIKADEKPLSRFNFATKTVNMADEGIQIDETKPISYRKWSEGKVTETRHFKNIHDLLANDGNNNVRAIAKLLLENPKLRHEFRGADIIASNGFDMIQRLAPDVRGILDGWGGSSVPKPSSNDAIYDNSVLNIAGYNAKKAFAVGGVRMNSFSDFMAHMFFDYAQAFADLSAKGLPMHSYTKELDFARLFGLTGGKINMSAIAAIRSNATDLSKIKRKVDKEAATAYEKSIAGLDISRLAEKLGKPESEITYDDVIQNLDDVDYVWADESIDVKKATLLQTGILYDKLSDAKANYCYELIRNGQIDEAFRVAGEENVNRGYAKHLGIITVGVSRAHILKLLRDPTIRMVIPYHRSGLNPVVAKALNIAFYDDFTDYQNTSFKKNGKQVGITKDDAKVKWKNPKNGKMESKKLNDFSFYDYFGKTIDGVFYDGKATAAKYLEWCENGVYDESVGDNVYYISGGGYILASDLHAQGVEIIPKFSEFASEDNYYKLVEDFDCYDTITGEHSAQEAVDLFHDGLPSDYKDVLVKALKAEQKVSDDFRDHLDNKGLRDEIMAIVGKNGYKPSDDGVKYQKKKFSEQVDEVLDGTFDRTNAVYVGETPKILQDIGLNGSLPMLTTARHLRNANKPKNAKKHYHGLTVDQLKALPEKIANPVMVMDSLDETSNSVIVVTDMLDPDGSPIVAVIKADGKGTYNSVEVDANFVSTYYGRDGFDAFIGLNVEADTFLFIDKEKSRKLSNPAKVQFFGKLEAYDFDTIIRQTRAVVNRISENSDNGVKKQIKKDSEGRTLTAAQQEFFKDSKVRDKNGNLMVLYHGTTSNFNIFKKGDVGFHFGTKGAARGRVGYGKNVTVKEVYLNITNPIVFDEDLGSWDADYMLTKALYDKGILTQDEAESILLTDNKQYRRTTEAANKKLASVLLEKGYDGIAYSNTFETKKPTTSYIVFSSNQVKDTANKAPTSDPDIRYQKKRDPAEYAPVFYSQMGKLIDGIKMEKIGTASVINFLKGKGIRHDEIKWSGIEAFLEGKRSVTKAELQKFVAASQLQIVEQSISETVSYTEEQSKELDRLSQENQKAWDAIAQGWEDLFGEEMPIIDIMTAHNPERAMSRLLREKNATQEEKDKLFAHMADIVINDVRMENIADEAKRATPIAKWSQYKIDGGSNYRELVFQMPNSSYSNQAMRTHWGQDAEGVLAHARIQDVTTADGKKMLFIEEIQSDWHNEGHTEGYADAKKAEALRKKAAELDKKNKAERAEVTAALAAVLEGKVDNPVDGAKSFIDFCITNQPFFQKYAEKYSVPTEIIERIVALRKSRNDALLADNEAYNLENGIPDAPFRDTYHEYVLKRLIRMAAEEGYDLIGWTPSDIQADRWSYDYAEGYRIEYDQEIPKFLRKYGKKWGATVGTTKTPEGYDVWSMPITEQMEQSVLYEGQPLYQKKKLSNRTILANALESAIDTSTQEGQNELANLKKYQAIVGKIEELEAKRAELSAKAHEIRFKKGRTPDETKRMNAIQFEANQTANQINTYDKQLLRLEAMSPVKNVLQREKDMVRKRTEEKGREKLAAVREKAAETQRKLLEKARESRKKGIEGRRKTEMRRKIKDITKELDHMIRNPTQKKHIKEELRKGVANALSAINMDTVGADERVAIYNELIAKSKDQAEIDELTKTRDLIQLQGDNLQEKLNTLQAAYEKIKNSEDIELNLAYQEVITNSIKAVSEKIGKTSIRNMTLEQLEMVYDLFSMIRKTVRDANKLFKLAKFETIMQTAEAVNDEVRTVGGEHYKRFFLSAAMRRMGWSLLKPYVAFRTIGSDTLTGLYKNLRAGEDTFWLDVSEAQAFIEAQYEKHGYKSWNMKETKEFAAKSGKKFKLTLEQMMSLYAYSRREQAIAHIIEGGIVFEGSMIVEKNKLGVPIKYEVTTKDAFNLSEETLGEIINSLTAEQKAYVEEMQAYLSDTMGAKGNEVSMELLGVKLFKEKFYLPIKSSQYYMNFKPEEAGEVKLKSPAFSKETVTHANNPVVLHNFTDLWAEHINDMSMYHSFVLALEDFTKVYNYKTKTDEKVATMDTKATIATAYGDGATKYISNFLKSLNGGVRSDTVGWAEMLTSLTKKSAVLGSASVAIQQPSAIMRAMAYIKPKYFVMTTHKSLNLVKHKADWAELKKYAPIAGIKEMGRFDVGMGQGTVDWIQSNKTVMNKVEDVLSIAPALMDEITWVNIWNAVKLETVSKHKDLRPNSEEFLKVAGERFTDVVSLSQVYDSVFSRSDLMRNKSWIAKTLTAFMAEPTTTLNMLWDAYVQGKRSGSVGGFMKKTSATTGAIVASIVLNALLKSIVTAARDDDEDESYAEKYLEHFFGDLGDNLNPLTLIPIAKDIVSIFQGYDVERMDVSLISDLKNAIDAFDSDTKTTYEKWSGITGAVAAFFGLPVKNVERDIRAAVNIFIGDREDTTSAGIRNAIYEGWTGETKSNGQQLYEAMLDGDTEQINRVKGRFKDQSAINTAIRKALRENDPRIKEAAQANVNGDFTEGNRIAEEILSEGNFTKEDIKMAIRAEVDAMTEDEDKAETTEEKEVSFYEMEYFYTAAKGDNTAMAYAIREDIIQTAVANGKSLDDAEDSFNSSFQSRVRKEYDGGELSDSEAIQMLVSYGGVSREDAAHKVQYWNFKLQYPDYDLSADTVKKYYAEVEPSGITVDTYYDYKVRISGIEGDKDKNGNTINGSYKKKVMAVINSMPITSRQKDALYYAEGWTESRLYEAPWH